jgi:hypothetical protein
MKKIFGYLFLLLSINICYANVAQPGMWNAGYAGRFTTLFEKDSVHFGKIVMQKERVLINVYPGFAAVKGEYWMHNPTNETISMTVGYPLNGGEYEEEKIGYVQYEQLSNLKVIMNDLPVSSKFTGDTSVANSNNLEWYYWQATFPPNSVTKITVYFLTDNSKAGLRKGYNSEDGNAFTYVLESGRAWGGNINSGDILIKLRDGLTLKNIRGIIPDKILKGDDTHLQFSFKDLEPGLADNILFWYDKKEKNFNFKSIASNADQYFKELDSFPIDEFNKGNFSILNKDNFKVKDTASLLFIGFLVLVALLGIALVAGVVYLIYKLIRRS